METSCGMKSAPCFPLSFTFYGRTCSASGNNLSVLPEKHGGFLRFLRAKILDYAVAFLDKCNGIWGVFMRCNCRNLIKLRELAKLAKS